MKLSVSMYFRNYSLYHSYNRYGLEFLKIRIVLPEILQCSKYLNFVFILVTVNMKIDDSFFFNITFFN